MACRRCCIQHAVYAAEGLHHKRVVGAGTQLRGCEAGDGHAAAHQHRQPDEATTACTHGGSTIGRGCGLCGCDPRQQSWRHRHTGVLNTMCHAHQVKASEFGAFPTFGAHETQHVHASSIAFAYVR